MANTSDMKLQQHMTTILMTWSAVIPIFLPPYWWKYPQRIKEKWMKKQEIGRCTYQSFMSSAHLASFYLFSHQKIDMLENPHKYKRKIKGEEQAFIPAHHT